MDGEQIPLPCEVYRVLRQAVEVMRRGQAARVAPQSLLLTTQEAAEFLGVSRPTLVKLLEDGAIPFHQPIGIAACGFKTSSTFERADTRRSGRRSIS